MIPLPELERAVLTSWPRQRWQDTTVLIAVSGGADSIAMLRALSALKTGGAGRLVVGHFNHGLRGDESDADQALVERLGQELPLPLEIGRAESRNATAGQISEEAARDARYAFLREVAERIGARYVATAHTADDQAETILHHVLRGTSLSGLAGMPRTRPLGPAVTLIRPMLKISRSQVLSYLAALGQAYRDDSTNIDPRFTRNRIRHELLPLLEREYAPGARQALLRLGTLAADAGRVLAQLTSRLLEQAVTVHDRRRVTIDCEALAGQDRHLVREVFVLLWRRQDWPQQSMGYIEWNQLADLALDNGGVNVSVTTLPGAVRAQKRGGQLELLASGGCSGSG